MRIFFGFHHVRCRDCGYRFTDHPWRWPHVLYARCPLCHGMILRNWTEKYNYPPWYRQIKILLGAKRQRCEACRHNFLSLRRRWSVKKNGSK
jgi:C4-type Zn-finger protein